MMEKWTREAILGFSEAFNNRKLKCTFYYPTLT